MSRDPAIANGLKKVVVDVLLIVAMVLSLLTVKLAWKPFQRGFFCGDESLMFPFKEDTVPVGVLRLYGFMMPGIAILICEFNILRHEKDDTRAFGKRIPVWVRGIYCVAVSFSLGVICVEMLADIGKITIGRLRPHFFEICKPTLNCSDPQWQGRYIEPHQYYCSTHNIHSAYRFKNTYLSFPSGHSCLSAYTMVYFIIYLERRMVFWPLTRLVRHCMQFIALGLSWYTALSRVTDYKHHWSDVLAGYTLGVVVAVIVLTWCTDFLQPKKPVQQEAQQQRTQETQRTPVVSEVTQRTPMLSGVTQRTPLVSEATSLTSRTQ